MKGSAHMCSLNVLKESSRESVLQITVLEVSDSRSKDQRMGQVPIDELCSTARDGSCFAPSWQEGPRSSQSSDATPGTGEP